MNLISFSHEILMKEGLESYNAMIGQEIIVNGKKFHFALTEQIIMNVKRLKSLYNTAYEDPESFEDVSSSISNIITQISESVEPKISDYDLGGVIQEIMRAVEEKSKERFETEKEKLDAKANKKPRKFSKKTVKIEKK